MAQDRNTYPTRRVLNVVQVVGLDALATLALFVVLLVVQVSPLVALLWAWIGGAVLTLWLAVLLVSRREARCNQSRKHHEDMVAEWDEDALDASWQDRIAPDQTTLGMRPPASGTVG